MAIAGHRPPAASSASPARGARLDPILCAVDGSKPADRALRVARALAVASGSELVALHVVRPAAAPAGRAEAQLRLHDKAHRAARTLLDESILRAGAESLAVPIVRPGDPEVAIRTLARELDAGIVVTGARGRGAIRGAVLGSVSQSLLRTLPVPVLVVPARANRGLAGAAEERGAVGLGRVVCGIDGTSEALAGVRAAARLAGASEDADVILVRVRESGSEGGYPPSPLGAARMLELETERIVKELRSARARVGALAARPLIAIGDPATVLDEVANEHEADVIAVGVPHRGRIGAAVLGSTAIGLIACSRHPVLIGNGHS